MNGQHFNTLQEHSADRVACWSGINQRVFGALRAQSLHDGPLDAQMATYSVGALRMVNIQAPAHRVSRDPGAEMPMDSTYKLVLQLEGRANLARRDRSFQLRAGNWSLYDPREPYAITNHENTRLLAVLIPRERLRGFKVPQLHTCEASTPAMQGMHAVLGSYLCSVAAQLDALPDSAGQALSETLLGLVASTLTAHRHMSAEYADLPAVLKARVKHYVNTHLGECDLSIDGIAREMRCSKRYLHLIFEDETTTLDRYIWSCRLDRCRDELLQDGEPAQRSVSEIAYTWGFNSSAHFSRLFKARFGQTPSEYQRAGQASLTPH